MTGKSVAPNAPRLLCGVLLSLGLGLLAATLVAVPPLSLPGDGLPIPHEWRLPAAPASDGLARPLSVFVFVTVAFALALLGGESGALAARTRRALRWLLAGAVVVPPWLLLVVLSVGSTMAGGAFYLALQARALRAETRVLEHTAAECCSAEARP